MPFPELGIVIFLLAGLPAALLLYERPLAIGMAAALSLIGAQGALVAHLAADLPIAPVWAGLMAIGALPLATHRGRAAVKRNVAARSDGWSIALLGAIGGLTVLLAVFPEAADWDARNIWFLHARWLLEPADLYLRAQIDPAILVAHPDYPAIGPAAVAIVWRITGTTGDLELATRLVTMLNLAMILVAVSWLTRLPEDRPGSLRAPVVVLLAVALTAIHPGQGRNNGYMDVLQGAAVLAAMASVLVGATRRLGGAEALGIVVLGAVAANVKLEGLPFLSCALVAALLVVRTRRALLAATIGGVGAFVASATFTLALTRLGRAPATDSGGIAGRVTELVTPGSTAWQAISTMTVPYLVPYALVFLALTCAAVVATSQRGGAPIVRRAVAAMAIAQVLMLGILVLTYALGNLRSDLAGWLGASFFRVHASLSAVALGAAGLALLGRGGPVPADARDGTSVLSSGDPSPSILNASAPHQEPSPSP